jgi:hypothetical protein
MQAYALNSKHWREQKSSDYILSSTKIIFFMKKKTKDTHTRKHGNKFFSQVEREIKFFNNFHHNLRKFPSSPDFLCCSPYNFRLPAWLWKFLAHILKSIMIESCKTEETNFSQMAMNVQEWDLCSNVGTCFT